MIPSFVSAAFMKISSQTRAVIYVLYVPLSTRLLLDHQFLISAIRTVRAATVCRCALLFLFTEHISFEIGRYLGIKTYFHMHVFFKFSGIKWVILTLIISILLYRLLIVNLYKINNILFEIRGHMLWAHVRLLIYYD